MAPRSVTRGGAVYRETLHMATLTDRWGGHCVVSVLPEAIRLPGRVLLVGHGALLGCLTLFLRLLPMQIPGNCMPLSSPSNCRSYTLWPSPRAHRTLADVLRVLGDMQGQWRAADYR